MGGGGGGGGGNEKQFRIWWEGGMSWVFIVWQEGVESIRKFKLRIWLSELGVGS